MRAMDGFQVGRKRLKVNMKKEREGGGDGGDGGSMRGGPGLDMPVGGGGGGMPGYSVVPVVVDGAGGLPVVATTAPIINTSLPPA